MKLLLTLFVFTALSASLFAKDTEAEKIVMQNKNVLKMAVKEMSAKLPQKVDDFTQLVAINAKGEQLINTFEINTGAKSDETVIKEGKERKMGERVLGGICKSSKRFIESGIGISYIYNSAVSKGRLFRFDANKKVCENIYGPAYFNP